MHVLDMGLALRAYGVAEMFERLKKVKEQAQAVARGAGIAAVAGVSVAYLSYKARQARQSGNPLLVDVKISRAACAFHDLMCDYIEQKIQGGTMDIGDYAILREDFKCQMIDIFSRTDDGMIEEFCRDHNISSMRDKSEMN